MHPMLVGVDGEEVTRISRGLIYNELLVRSSWGLKVWRAIHPLCRMSTFQGDRILKRKAGSGQVRLASFVYVWAMAEASIDLTL